MRQLYSVQDTSQFGLKYCCPSECSVSARVRGYHTAVPTSAMQHSTRAQPQGVIGSTRLQTKRKQHVRVARRT